VLIDFGSRQERITTPFSQLTRLWSRRRPAHGGRGAVRWTRAPSSSCGRGNWLCPVGGSTADPPTGVLRTIRVVPH